MANYKTCKKCDAQLLADDLAINQKLISRNVTEFFCIDCLAAYFGTDRKTIEDRIAYYRESGQCGLFR